MYFHFWQKFEKFEMVAIFGEMKFFLKIAKSTFLRYPVGRKFRRNRSILHVFHSGQKFENSKWPPFLGRVNFLKISKSTLLGYPVG